MAQAQAKRVYPSLVKSLDLILQEIAHNKTCHQTQSIRIKSRWLVFKQLKRKNCYFLQLYLTGVLHPLDESQNMPHNVCRIRNDPKIIYYYTKKYSHCKNQDKITQNMLKFPCYNASREFQTEDKHSKWCLSFSFCQANIPSFDGANCTSL